MPSLVYYNPANPRQKYYTMTLNDPNIPAGYVDSQGSDGAIPEALKVYPVGLASGGYPKYQSAANEFTVNPTWPNGIMNGYGGGKVTG